MVYVFLVVVFVAVFGFIAWRIISGRGSQNEVQPEATYECPICNEAECDCRKVDDSRG